MQFSSVTVVVFVINRQRAFRSQRCCSEHLICESLLSVCLLVLSSRPFLEYYIVRDLQLAPWILQ